jgi:hypothetical protein
MTITPAPSTNNNTATPAQPSKEGSRTVTLPAATSRNGDINNLPFDKLYALRPAPDAPRLQVSMVEAP